MKVLILGSGGREHALGWLLRKQNECSDVWIHPGNSGTLDCGFKNFPLATNLTQVIQEATRSEIKLVVIGPEALLAQGYADAFRKEHFLVVGPNQAAAQLESSKIFAKEFMKQASIPTASSRVFTCREELERFPNIHWPWVLKLDGLAAGKGVVIAHSPDDVSRFCDVVWGQRFFGPGPHRVLTEDFISGREMSYMGFCDGRSFIPLETATDYKTLYDQNEGPNTGGMGAISPSPFLSSKLEGRIHQEVIRPLLSYMQQTDMDFRGVLFIGLMIDRAGTPWVLEFNTRLGDPETQCVLPRLKSSLLDLLVATAARKLEQVEKPVWDQRQSVFVVATCPGYPHSPELGGKITGLDQLEIEGQLFFAGVRKKESDIFTDGGRVLGVGRLADTLLAARQQVYAEIAKLHWPGIHYRRDIGLNLGLEPHKTSAC